MESYVLLPFLFLLTAAVCAVLLAVYGKTGCWIGTVCAFGVSAVTYWLIPMQTLIVVQYAELKSFLGFNLIPLVKHLRLLPFQWMECLAAPGLIASEMALRTRKSGGNTADAKAALFKGMTIP